MGVLDLEQQPGRCAFCDDPLGPRRKVICGKPECKRDYHEVYDRKRRGTILFKVESLFGTRGDWSQLLSCGHCVPAPLDIHRKAGRRRCPTCAGGS